MRPLTGILPLQQQHLEKTATMTQQQISTSVSDGVLAFASLHSAYKVSDSSFFGTVALGIVGVAACFGTARFAYKQPSQALLNWHDNFSWLSKVLGMSCIPVAFYRQAGIEIVPHAHLAVALAVVVLHGQLASRAQCIATEIVSTAAVLSTLLYSIVAFNAYALVGSVLYIVSGTVVKTTGYLAGVPRVDIFHYLLAVANIAFMMGLSQKVQPLFYTPSGGRL